MEYWEKKETFHEVLGEEKDFPPGFTDKA